MKAISKLLLPVVAGTAVLISAASGASAQGLGAKVTGTWTLVTGTETYADGKKLMPWATGSLMLDSTGHFSFFLIGKDQPKTNTSVRIPVGPAVAYYGTYTVDEPNKMLTWKIDHTMSGLMNGETRTQKVSFSGDAMTLTGSEVKTPEGPMVPVNTYEKAK
jgi:hypothetical protein